MVKKVVISGVVPNQVVSTALQIAKVYKYAYAKPDSMIEMETAFKSKVDIVIAGGPADLLLKWAIGNNKQALMEFQKRVTHQIIIPYTLDTDWYWLEDAKLQRIFEGLLLGKAPSILLANKIKEDNWKLVVSFLSDIIIAKEMP